ncbi:MAG: isoprenyl transferase-like protein [Paenibacillaceae bacterium]|jgi:competence protein ComQ|nr:isoprenyl transferase-like protein [Paenibacillaceae bacterium]
MNQETALEMERIIRSQPYAGEFQELLLSFVAEKAKERGSWSDIVRTVHNLLAGDCPRIEAIAAAAELAVLASDILDDLQDQDQSDKLWMQCPPSHALNSVVALMMCFTSELGVCGLPPEAIAEAGRIISRSLQGQYRDIRNSAESPDEYLQLVQEKSGSIFQLMVHLGSAAAGAENPQRELLLGLADCTGLIHQIQNDLRDITRLGQKNDILMKRKTLPVLFLLSLQDEWEFRFFQQYYRGEMEWEEFLQRTGDYEAFIDNSGCREYSLVVQGLCVDRAEELMGQLDAPPSRKEQLKEFMYGAFVRE